ncbi:MAG: extensin family protein [Pseudomonadota bacterium]
MVRQLAFVATLLLCADVAAQPVPADNPRRAAPTAAAPPQDGGPPRPRRRPIAPQPAERRTDVAGPDVTPATDCLGRIARLKIEATRLPPIREGVCGAEAPIKVTEIAGVRLSPAATLRCETAEATAKWLRDGLIPAARRHLRGQPTEIFVAASYHCRKRRTGRGGETKLSEHGRANAIDVRGIKLADGRTVSIAPKGAGRAKNIEEFQAEIRAAGCDAFKTVIGPLTDPAHHDHLHFDLAQRRRGGVVCR